MVFWKRKKQNKEIELWEECGKNETEKNVTTTLDLKNYKNAKEITLYHIHPKNCKHIAAAETFSFDDLSNYIDFAFHAYKKLNVEKVELKIFVPSGIYTLGIDEKEVNKDFRKKFIMDINDFASKKELFRDDMWNCENNSELNKKFAQTINKLSGMIEIKFEPFE